jgi:cyclopropane fatty-acyl-phospholipid synthase-like methyltransferase
MEYPVQALQYDTNISYQSGWLSQHSEWLQDTVEGAWIPAFGAYLTSCTRVFRGSSVEVKQWKCYCDLSRHLLLKLRIC